MHGPRRITALAMLAAVSISACGGGGDEEDAPEPVIAADDVVAAFEEAGGGYEYERATTLVDGATAYAPVNSANPEEVGPLNEALGDGSVLWQVLVFDGPAPPLDSEAAEAAAFSSGTFEEAEPGVYLGDHDIAYIADRNVVITGPVLDGDLEDNTLVRWKAVLDAL